MSLVEFKQKFKVEDLKIYESSYWVWSLRPHQSVFGAGILSLKRGCQFLSQLEVEEFGDLKNIITVIEATLKEILNYDVINYLMLMMVDKHVHYHVFPRFKDKRNILGDVWIDETWPAVPNIVGETLSDERLNEILHYIRSKLIL